MAGKCRWCGGRIRWSDLYNEPMCPCGHCDDEEQPEDGALEEEV